MATTAKLTDGERDMLAAIRDCEYHDGAEPLENPVWVGVVCEDFGASAGGIMASLCKKGLAGTDGNHTRSGLGGDYDDATCWITQAGLDALDAEGR